MVLAALRVGLEGNSELPREVAIQRTMQEQREVYKVMVADENRTKTLGARKKKNPPLKKRLVLDSAAS